jgi:DNA primase large subunit
VQLLRYPFSVDARKSTQELTEARRKEKKLSRDIDGLIDLLEDKTNSYLIEEAERRVLSALDQAEIVTVNTGSDTDVLVYSAARLIVEKIGDSRLKEYQAEAESKAVNRHLSKENENFIMDLCRSAFNWSVEAKGGISERAKLPLILRSYEFKIRFEDFLEIAPSFHSEEWKLINRHIDKGWVPIRRSELDRLISGKFKRLIQGSSLNVPTLPERLTEAVQRIETESRGKIKRTEPVQITTSIITAFPPCISQMHDDSLMGKNLSHEARFALAAFLLKIGMSQDDVLGSFKAAPDFARNLAEYQVRHIASKAAGEGYTPPGCKKMQGNSLCPVYLGTVKDPLCEYILHPLAFYQTRAWEISKGIDDHSWYAKKKKKRQNL